MSSKSSKKSFSDIYQSSPLGAAIQSQTEHGSQAVQAAAVGASSTQRLEGAQLVPLELIVPSPLQIRKTFNQEELQELADNIKEHGILQPLVVRLTDEKLYEIVAGERRYRAASLAGLEKVPVVVTQHLADNHKAELAMLTENIQRANLTSEEERAYFLVLQNRYNYSVADIARLIHKSASYVTRRLYGLLEGMQATPVSEDSGLVAETVLPYEEQSLAAISNPVEQVSVEVNESVTGAKVKKFKPTTTFNRIHSSLQTTFHYLQQNQPDQAAREQIEQGLTELEEQVRQIRQQLAGSDAPID